ncbi:hypothetical protein GE061_008656 [Apolygus lucorum]|uniref:Uncharacterized protein n=1 Tax=Apolygus lucorum TaxID=248454 RepID=A0A8S9WJU1_APOLU|nr:hypothetical protein GE061_008656 [Apolygus lucorum]
MCPSKSFIYFIRPLSSHPSTFSIFETSREIKTQYRDEPALNGTLPPFFDPRIRPKPTRLGNLVSKYLSGIVQIRMESDQPEATLGSDDRFRLVRQEMSRRFPRRAGYTQTLRMAICGLYISTSGLLGANLGADEHDIILLGYAVIDLNTNQVLGLQEYVVKPSNCDLHSNFLSEDVKQETTLTEVAVRNSSLSLQNAISLDKVRANFYSMGQTDLSLGRIESKQSVLTSLQDELIAYSSPYGTKCERSGLSGTK